jgi:hypothetical protein
MSLTGCFHLTTLSLRGEVLYGRGYGPVVRLQNEQMYEWMHFCKRFLQNKGKFSCAIQFPIQNHTSTITMKTKQLVQHCKSSCLSECYLELTLVPHLTLNCFLPEQRADTVVTTFPSKVLTIYISGTTGHSQELRKAGLTGCSHRPASRQRKFQLELLRNFATG